MFAVVEISGKQFSVKEKDKIRIPLLNNKIGDSVKFERVMLLKNNGDTLVGAPVIEKATITATVLEHGKDKKVLVFKKKRRKDYKVTKGHRQDFSLVRIDTITAPGGKKKKTEKEPVQPEPEEVKAPAAEEPAVKKSAEKTPETPEKAAETTREEEPPAVEAAAEPAAASEETNENADDENDAAQDTNEEEK